MSLEDTMEKTGELSPEQHTAMRHSIRIGRLLVNEYPEIAVMYRRGMTYLEIAEDLDVKGKYSAFSDDVAKTSIYRAIRGHPGGFGIEPYDGLIQDLDELLILEHEHHEKNGRELAEAINPNTGRRYIVEAARKGVESRGQTLWVKKEGTEHIYDEIELAQLLSLQQEYQHQKGPHKGRGDISKIIKVLDDEYHDGKETRKVRTLVQGLYEYRLSLGK